MGAKFFKTSNRGKKYLKRFNQSRSWFRGLKWVAYHAHPNLVAGHPFKGGDMMSIGMLANPEMAKFAIATPILFVPPNPFKTVGYVEQEQVVPTFSDFFDAYFGGQTLSMEHPAAGKMLGNMRQCYMNNKSNPVDACQYYINGFKRVATQ